GVVPFASNEGLQIVFYRTGDKGADGAGAGNVIASLGPTAGQFAQWVDGTHIKGVPPPAALTISATAPVSPLVGDMWWDSVGGQLYIRYDDGNTVQWVIANNTAGDFVKRAGDTMTGPLTLAANPTAALQAATKQYVDAIVMPNYLGGLTLAYA